MIPPSRFPDLTRSTRHFSLTPYPVPPLQILSNVLLNMYMIYKMITSPERKALDAKRQELGLTQSTLRPYGEGAQFVLYSSVPELEFPHVPLDCAIFCGPLLTPEPMLSMADYPDLGRFFDQGRTVYVNLGSLFTYEERDVRAIAEALYEARARLNSRGAIQALWKLPRAKSPQFRTILDEILGENRSWIQIKEWVEPNALAVLQHPKVALLVHHGGASKWKFWFLRYIC
jgi:UDP:flavonoid glycosyltransferase YjiC (YdhE family)